MNSINDLIENIKNILNISNERVILNRDIVRYETELDWDADLESWVICYLENPSEFSIIHELGHIYFAKKKVMCEDFAIPRYRNPRIIRDILPLLNNLIDDFINYNLTHFDEIYPFYREKLFYYLDNLQDFKNRIEQENQINTLISWYFLFFIDFNYILKENDKKERLPEITDLLNCLENNILQLTPIKNKKKIKNISKKLDLFKRVRSTRKPIKIVSFFIRVLLTLDLWKKKTIKKQMKYIFPKIFNK